MMFLKYSTIYGYVCKKIICLKIFQKIIEGVLGEEIGIHCLCRYILESKQEHVGELIAVREELRP